MNRAIKVDNSSDYWIDFEGELSIYGFIHWKGEELTHMFWDKKIQFGWEYYYLSKKYGLACSVYPYDNIRDYEQMFTSYKNKFEDKREHNPILFMHVYKQMWAIPSYLFINLNEKPKRIVSANPIIELENLKYRHPNWPVKIALDIGFKTTTIYYYIDNDLFNLGLENKKCREFKYPIDNSDLAYLNTPRLNSFIRDLKKLCFKYGATDFEFENLGLIDFTENGVLLDGEIIYYEDIYDILPDEHRYKPFEEIELDL